jgi:glycosyltransferase involved in cell wall biosynthesis
VNLLYTITTYPPSIGGAQIHTHELLRRLARTHDVRVACHWDRNRTDWLLGTTLRVRTEPGHYEIDGIPVTMLHATRWRKALMAPAVPLYFPTIGWSAPWIARQGVGALRDLARDLRPDVVHNSRVGREPLSLASLAIARERDLPFVLTTHHHPRFETVFHRVYHRLIAEADACVARTEWERARLVHFGAKPENVAVIGVGPVLADDADPVRFRERFGLGDRRIILFIGHKYRYKGIPAMVDAMALLRRRFADAVMVFVGPTTPFSERYFQALGPRLDVVELPAVDLQTKTDAIAACEVLCLPSQQEAFGGVITQAWSLGKPVVTSRIPALAEIVEEGRDGLVSDDEPSALAERLGLLLENPDYARRLGREGRDKVAARYTWDVLCNRTLALYERLLAGRTLAVA